MSFMPLHGTGSLVLCLNTCDCRGAHRHQATGVIAEIDHDGTQFLYQVEHFDGQVTTSREQDVILLGEPHR